jgi:hypothetical protein
MTESLEKNGSGVTAPQPNTPASEGGVSSEVKTPENKTSEGALKAAELLLAIIGIVKLVIDLLKKGSKASEAFTQREASDQNISSETLQSILEKIANKNTNPEKNLTGAEESNDQEKKLQNKILESLGLDPKIIEVEGDNKLQEALKKFIKILEPVDKERELLKPSAKKENEGGAKDSKDLNTVGKEVGVEGDKATKKNLEIEEVKEVKIDNNEPKKQTPTKPFVDAKNPEMSHVQRLLQMRQVSNESGRGGRG